MERKINGKTIEQVIKELQEPLKEMAVRDGQAYYPHGLVRRRMDEVLGLNYDFILLGNGPQLIETENVLSFVGSGRILIRDDDGKVVCIRDSGKGTAIKYKRAKKSVKKPEGQEKKDTAVDTQEPEPQESDTQKPCPLNPSNDYKSAVSHIFKACAAMVGVADDLDDFQDTNILTREQAQSAIEEYKKNGGKSNRGGNQNNETVEFSLTTGFTTNGNRAVATAKGTDGKVIQIVFWAEDQQALGTTAQTILQLKSGRKIVLEGLTKPYNGRPQFHLKKLLSVA